jgi:hypothetical protein
LLHLPVEVIKILVDLIPLEDQFSNVRLVSKLFFDIVGLSHFNLGVTLSSEMEQLARVFGRYQGPLGLSFKKPEKLTAADLKHLTALTQLTSLSMKKHIEDSTLKYLTNLVSLDMLDTQNITTSTLQSLSKLTHLRAQIVRDADVDVDVALNQLESLNITSTKDWPNLRCDNLTSLTATSSSIVPQEWLAHFTRLKVLCLANTERLNSCVIRVPTDLCANLTSLMLNKVSIENKIDIPWHQLKVLSLNAPPHFMDPSALRQISKCSNLASLRIIAVNNQALVDAIDVNNLKLLESFTLLVGGAAPFGSVRNLLPQLNKDTLKELQTSIWHDHSDCLEEISKMTNLESLKLRLNKPSAQHDDVDTSPLMTLTKLTTLELTNHEGFGLENLTNLTRLNDLKIHDNDQKHTLETLHLSSFNNLTSLDIVRKVKVLKIRGATQLQRLCFEATRPPESDVEFDPEQMVCLKEISILSSRSIPWTDFAKCTALERIAIETFELDDSILALQSLKHLTRLANFQPGFFHTRCRHFDVNYLTSLTQLQSIDIVEPSGKCT